MNYAETEDNVIVKKTLTYSRIKFSKPETIKASKSPQLELEAPKSSQQKLKAVKRKVDENTKPLKKIKLHSKPQYNFIDSQDEGITPCINTKAQSRTKGPLSNTFSTFINKNPVSKIQVKVLSAISEYGSQYISVDVGQTNIPKIRGKMTLLYRGLLKLSNALTITDPKVMVIDNTEYLVAKEVIPMQ